MAYLLTRNRADAEDLVQAALAKTYQAWDRIEDRGARGRLRPPGHGEHAHLLVAAAPVEEYPTDEIPDQPVVDRTRATARCRTRSAARSTGCRSGCGPRWCCVITRT